MSSGYIVALSRAAPSSFQLTAKRRSLGLPVDTCQNLRWVYSRFADFQDARQVYMTPLPVFSSGCWVGGVVRCRIMR